MIWFGERTHGAFIARLAMVGFDPEVDHVVSRVTPEGNVRGGFIYTNYTGRTVQMHFAGVDRKWGTPELAWAAFDFPFNALKVEEIIGMISSNNQWSLGVAYKAGFTPLVTIPRVVRGGDMKVLSMKREQCTWLALGARYAQNNDTTAQAA